VVDHHVDRPGVEALQDVELTGTNRSDILNYAYRNHGWRLEVLLCTALGPDGTSVWGLIFPPAIGWSYGSSSRLGIQVSGVHSGGDPPVPIPNTAVKPACANDSRTAGSLESRSAPDYMTESPSQQCDGLSSFNERSNAVPGAAERSAGVTSRARAGRALSTTLIICIIKGDSMSKFVVCTTGVRVEQEHDSHRNAPWLSD
jgi:hypothetical protein